MALDTFAKSGVTTYTFTRGNTFPINHKYVPNQVMSTSGGGTSKTATTGNAQEFWSVTLNNITTADTNLLYSFLSNSLINWGEQLFTWTDYESTARLVRLWDSDISLGFISGDIHAVSLTLKIET